MPRSLPRNLPPLLFIFSLLGANLTGTPVPAETLGPPPAIETDRTATEEAELLKQTRSVALRGDDERLRPEAQFQTMIGGTLLTITGAVNLDLNWQRNLDLDSDRDRDRLRFGPELNSNFIFFFPQEFYVFTELSLADTLTFREGDKPDNAFQLLIDELFIQAALPLPIPSAIRLGRQQFFEGRRWVFSDELDGIRLFLDPDPWHLNASISAPIPDPETNLRIFDDIFRSRNQIDFLFHAMYDMPPQSQKSKFEAYILARADDSARDEDPIWIGIRSYGRPKFKFKLGDGDFLKALFKPRIRYWFDAAFVGGNVRSRSIRAFGMDVGASYIARKLPYSPFVTLGVAFGTGDANPAQGVDGNFRQTGFQSNSSKFGGVVNFDYYGVLFDPELSNLTVYTVGLGFRPLPRTSVDLVYHHYQQHQASPSLRDADVGGDLSGLSTNLGDEIDLVFGYREIQNVRIRWRNGYFIPGPAFLDQDHAFESRLDVLFSF